MATITKQMVHTSVSVGTGSTTALAANGDLVWILLENDSDEVIYIAFGTAAVLNQGIRLNAEGGSLELSYETGFIDHRQINAICASGSKNLLVTYA